MHTVGDLGKGVVGVVLVTSIHAVGEPFFGEAAGGRSSTANQSAPSL